MEIAFVSVDKLRFEMERNGGITSRILSIFFTNPNEFISTMLVGNNIACLLYTSANRVPKVQQQSQIFAELPEKAL